jgi:[citrate (pro-3S)-lyase] ligase
MITYEPLTGATDIFEYLDVLYEISSRVSIVIAVCDTPGKEIEDRLAGQIMKLGTKVNLSAAVTNHFHCPYIAIIDEGRLLYEHLGKKDEIAEVAGNFLRTTLKVVSKSLTAGGLAEIVICGVDCSVNKRCLNIVVYDKYRELIIDSRSYDTWIHEKSCVLADISGINAKLKRCKQIKRFNGEACYRKFALLSQMGYSPAQYLLDNNHRRISVAYSSEYNVLAELIITSISCYSNELLLVDVYSDEKVFMEHYWQGCFPTIRVKHITDYKESKYDVVIAIGCDMNETSKTTSVIDITEMSEHMVKKVVFSRAVAYFLEQNPCVGIYGYEFPYLTLINQSTDDFSEYEKRILQKRLRESSIRNEVIKNGEYDAAPMASLGYDSGDLKNLLFIPKSYVDMFGITKLEEHSSKYVNIKNGYRVTLDQPDDAEHTIWVLGDCTTYGIWSPDSGTISSKLQRILNSRAKGRKFKVENCGLFLAGGRLKFFGETLNALPVQSGDIVVYNTNLVRWCEINTEVIKTAQYFRRPHDYGEIYIDNGHVNEVGNGILSQAIYDYLESNQFSARQVMSKKYETVAQIPIYGIGASQYSLRNAPLAELAPWLESIRQYRPRIGSIVMNCNPFTLGHRYLVEQSAAKVEKLFIFVVEEDKSVFPFADRIELVRQGTADLPNVTVLPSGKFIISSLTFTDYFGKSEMQDRAIDSSIDVKIFAQHIAPALDITVRFAGEEPLDNVTRQYNETMARILPQHNVKFEVIPRKESDDEVISASRVRKLLEAKDFDAIAKIVPATTFEYLRDNWANKE